MGYDLPKMHWGADCVLLALLGAGDSGGLGKTVESLGMGDYNMLAWA